MALSKTVCMACYRRWGMVWSINPHSDVPIAKSAEQLWEEKPVGIVDCPEGTYAGDKGFWGGAVRINEDPPGWCPFELEHVLEEQNEES